MLLSGPFFSKLYVDIDKTAYIIYSSEVTVKLGLKIRRVFAQSNPNYLEQSNSLCVFKLNCFQSYTCMLFGVVNL